jgi:hypothetical protein
MDRECTTKPSLKLLINTSFFFILFINKHIISMFLLEMLVPLNVYAILVIHPYSLTSKVQIELTTK